MKLYENFVEDLLQKERDLKKEKREILKLLIKNGVDLNHTNEKGVDAITVRNNGVVSKYIQEKYPELYEEYLMKKDANKYNL